LLRHFTNAVWLFICVTNSRQKRHFEHEAPRNDSERFPKVVSLRMFRRLDRNSCIFRKSDEIIRWGHIVAQELQPCSSPSANGDPKRPRRQSNASLGTLQIKVSECKGGIPASQNGSNSFGPMTCVMVEICANSLWHAAGNRQLSRFLKA
jgi:hypothetical protein